MKAFIQIQLSYTRPFHFFFSPPASLFLAPLPKKVCVSVEFFKSSSSIPQFKRPDASDVIKIQKLQYDTFGKCQHFLYHVDYSQHGIWSADNITSYSIFPYKGLNKYFANLSVFNARNPFSSPVLNSYILYVRITSLSNDDLSRISQCLKICC